MTHANQPSNITATSLALLHDRIFHLHYQEIIDRRLPLLEALHNNECLSVAALVGMSLSHLAMGCYKFRGLVEPDHSITLAFCVPSLDVYWTTLRRMADALLDGHGITRWSITDGAVRVSYCYGLRDRAWRVEILGEEA